jgi:hypothetical protein
MYIKIIFLLIFTLLLTGCITTPYQKAGFFSSTGGYEDKKVREGLFFIKSKVNANTAPDIALKYWHRRASELCGHSEYLPEVSLDYDTNINPGVVTTSHQWPIATGLVHCNKRKQ